MILNGPVPGGGRFVMFAKGRVRRDRGGERHREHVFEGRVGPIEPDRDPPRPVVGLDAGDVGLRLAALLVLDRADDPLVQRRGGRAQAEHALERMLEVARLDGAAVRVHEALAQPQRVGPAVGGHLGEVLRQPGIRVVPAGPSTRL